MYVYTRYSIPQTLTRQNDQLMTVPTFKMINKISKNLASRSLFFVANLTRQIPCRHAKKYFQGKLSGANLTELQPILPITREQIRHYPHRSQSTPYSQRLFHHQHSRSYHPSRQGQKCLHCAISLSVASLLAPLLMARYLEPLGYYVCAVLLRTQLNDAMHVYRG